MGKRRDEIVPGLRPHPTGSHVSYYWVENDIVTIERVLRHRRNLSLVELAPPGEPGDDQE